MVTYSTEFWNKLETEVGEATAAILQGTGHTVSRNQEGGYQSTLDAGFYYCGAAYNPDQTLVTLDISAEQAENSVKIYWLPYKKGATTSILRSAYEGEESCRYFMTPRLEGCRFVLTEDKVLHVASDASGAADGSRGSATRDRAVIAVADGKRTRSLSISSNTMSDEWTGYPYEFQAWAFGFRKDGIWTYKSVIRTSSQTNGTWAIFMNP